jgi:hypothetical protein
MNTDSGVYGANYLKRGAVAMFEIGMNLLEDSIYPDTGISPLDGRNKYVIHFAKGALPPVNEFWSVTVYDLQWFTVPNPTNPLYARGSRSNLKRNADGSLDIYLQSENPGADKEANWLPTPAQPRAAARRERDAPLKQFEKAARRNEITVLTAPADAIVLHVAQRSVGSVMKEAEQLYTLVPLVSPLEAEVLVEGLDVGHVKTGSLTRLKLEAWPFQKHGALTGQLRTLSEDTFNRDPKKGGEARPHYKARIDITSTKLRDVPPTFRLTPGMSVTAEINAGERTVLSYFLYPLLRGLDGSIREP